MRYNRLNLFCLEWTSAGFSLPESFGRVLPGESRARQLRWRQLLSGFRNRQRLASTANRRSSLPNPEQVPELRLQASDGQLGGHVCELTQPVRVGQHLPKGTLLPAWKPKVFESLVH